MRRTGVAELPLHYGKAPPWLVKRMTELAWAISKIIVQNFGTEEFLDKLSNPYWFQSLGCCLGYDWHSSGVTTVLTGVLKSALIDTNLGLGVAGGKGSASRKCPTEIGEMGKRYGWSDARTGSLNYASRMSAKVDNTAIQSGFPLYHHAFFASERGDWVVVQQGMSILDRAARRYHWSSKGVKSFVEEPHDAIACDIVKERVLNMAAKESEECRRISVDLINDGPGHLRNTITNTKSRGTSLERWMPETNERKYASFSMPWNVNWKVLERAYEINPRDYEQLLGVRGVGPATVKGLACISEIVYGAPPSWCDPVKYSFAYGGKDGVPRPVDRRAMDESVSFLRDVLESAEIQRQQKLEAFRRLSHLVSDPGSQPESLQ